MTRRVSVGKRAIIEQQRREKRESKKGGLVRVESRLKTLSRFIQAKRRFVRVESRLSGIMFDANEFFDMIDKDKDGEVSFSELNEIMCLGDDQLRVFMAKMMKEVSYPSQRPAHHDKVSRATFHLNFVDALTDAAHLEPTPDEVEDIFCQIAKDSDGKVPYNKLYMSPTLTSFLSDMQIYGIISQFKKQHLESRTQRQVSFSRSVSVSMMANREGGGISKHDFCKYYPRYLKEVTQPDFMNNRSLVMGQSVLNESRRGLDVAFEHLRLTVTVGKKQINVLDDVTGRLSSNTMTAVMGGSGSGKSSLLNALCGRAHYGVVSGEIYINGHGNSKIEDHKGVIGFVPQEDIVYPDLSVRENLLFAGRLMLPAATTSTEISELADATLASLGLSRVADSLVGDEKRRGISGGEKKRVNIGLELMKKPNILFLDEPTSGLDSRSAFIVMKSLKNLVSEGVTVVSVIHQPRTDIYDMFDSLILLGIGGRTVYHGPADNARSYFESLGFQMKEGESQADWFLDISSGDIETSDNIDIETGGPNRPRRLSIFDNSFEVALRYGATLVLDQPDNVELGSFFVKDVANIRYATTAQKNVIQVGDKVVGIAGHSLGQMTLDQANALINNYDNSSTLFIQVSDQMEEEQDNILSNGESCHLLSPDKPSNEDGALVKSRLAREKLYRQWNMHFENVNPSLKAKYFNHPEAFPLPIMPKNMPRWRQLFVQLRRNTLLTWRNTNSRMIDAGIVLAAIFLITLLVGHTESSFNSDPSNLIWMMFVASEQEASEMLSIIFSYSIFGVHAIQTYAMMIGIITSVLIGLNASKIITDKKQQFCRESQSGVSVTTYYLAASITATVEQGLIAFIGSIMAYLILVPSTDYLVYFWNMFAVTWLTVSWALFLAILSPLEAVNVVVGFWCAFFGLLFCGVLAPGLYTSLYENDALAVFSGFVSPLRFFVEGLAVSEAKCLPLQGGFPIDANAFNRDKYQYRYPFWNHLTFMAHTDLVQAQISDCGGWYWWVGAVFAIGITIRIAAGIAINLKDRTKQGKKSFTNEVATDFNQCRSGTRSIFQSFIVRGILMFIVLAGFFVLSSWLILRENLDQSY